VSLEAKGKDWYKPTLDVELDWHISQDKWFFHIEMMSSYLLVVLPIVIFSCMVVYKIFFSLSTKSKIFME
jgi:hypothetical protein